MWLAHMGSAAQSTHPPARPRQAKLVAQDIRSAIAAVQDWFNSAPPRAIRRNSSIGEDSEQISIADSEYSPRI